MDFTRIQLDRLFKGLCIECGGKMKSGKPDEEFTYKACLQCRTIYKIHFPVILQCGTGEIDADGNVIWDELS